MQKLIAGIFGSHGPLVIVLGGVVVAAGTWQIVGWAVRHEARWWEKREQKEREARDDAAVDWPHANEDEEDPDGRAR